MNRLIIPIIVILILAAGIGAYFIFQKPAIPEPPIGKCGDGICDEFEKANPNLCPKDCQEQPAIPTLPTGEDYQDSPFGIWDTISGYGISEPDILSMSDLGVYWEAVPVPPLFPLRWEEWKSHYNKYKDSKIEPIPMIDLAHDGFYLNLVGYYKNIESAVAYFRDIDYWMLDVEVDSKSNKLSNYPEKYAVFIRLTYKALKNIRPSAKLAMAGGLGNAHSYVEGGYFDKVFNELEKLEKIEKNPSLYNWTQNPYNLTQAEFNLIFAPDNYEKYMDIHHFSDFELDALRYKEETENLIKEIKTLLKKYNYNNVVLWDTQTGTHSGKPAGLTSLYQSEKNQANYLIKKYILSLSLGVKKVFWTTTYEFLWEKNPEHYFSKVGLIYNGQGKDDLGFGIKKLSYYTYKKMVEILEGSDWSNIQTIQEKDGVYIYKFIKNSKPIWVAWNDNTAEKQITISGITSSQVKITQVVPKYETGKEVTDYNTAFNTETKSVSGGKITTVLKDSPVFIEVK